MGQQLLRRSGRRHQRSHDMHGGAAVERPLDDLMEEVLKKRETEETKKHRLEKSIHRSLRVFS